MRVVVTDSFRAYVNMQPETFTKGQELKGSLAVYFLDAGAQVKPADDEANAYVSGPADEQVPPAGAPEPPSELDITANAPEVLAWVGADPDRAAEALDAELAKDKPRSTLVKQLEKIAAAEAE